MAALHWHTIREAVEYLGVTLSSEQEEALTLLENHNPLGHADLDIVGHPTAIVSAVDLNEEKLQGVLEDLVEVAERIKKLEAEDGHD
jgi:hypothetical protein